MKRIAIAVLVLFVCFVCSCSIRPKQWIGAGLAVSTLPINLGVQSQPIRVGLTTALLASAIAVLELDARRDQTGDATDLSVQSDHAIAAGDYAQEICSPNVMICMGPYRAHRIESAIALPNGRYQVGTTVVSVIPVGVVTHRIVIPGPAEVAAFGAAWATVQSSCPHGCADSTSGDLPQ